MLKASLVELGDEHVALRDLAEFGGPGDAAGWPFVDALARRNAVEDLFLVLRGATEDMPQADEDRAHEAADRWGQGREVGRGRRGRAGSGDVFGGVGRAVFGATDKLVRQTAGARNKRAHLVQAGVQHLLGAGEAATIRDPPASRQGRRAAHETCGPYVAVDTTLVTEAVSKSSLAEQFVELVLVRRGNQGANFGNAGINVRGSVSFSGDGDADSPEKRVRQFERRRLGNVEAVDEAVADQIEIAGDGRTCFAAEGTQARRAPARGRR